MAIWQVMASAHPDAPFIQRYYSWMPVGDLQIDTASRRTWRGDEEIELTADFLLSKPVSRAQVVTSKLLAALSSLTVTNLVVWAALLLVSVLMAGH